MSLAQYEDGIDGCELGVEDVEAEDLLEETDDDKSAIGACAAGASVARIDCALDLAALRGRASTDVLRGAELAAGAGKKASKPDPGATGRAARCVCDNGFVEAAGAGADAAAAGGASSCATRFCGGADL